MTEQHKANIEELNDKHKANIEELTEVNQTGVDVLKGQFREATLKRIEGHEDKLRELREEHGQFLAEKEEEYNMTVGELDEESKQNNQKIADLEDASEINNQTIADLQQTNRMLVTNHESDINEINARDLEDSRGLAAIHTEQINALKEENEGYKSEITSLEEENKGYISKRTSLETTHQATINQINEDHVAEIERKEGENQFYIDGLLESHKSTIERFSTGLLETRGQLDASERRVAELEESNSEDLDKLNEWKAYTERLVDSIAKIFDIGGIENASDIDELNRFLLDLDTFKKKASNFKLQMAGKLGISPQSDEDDILGQTDNILSELQILRSQVDSLGIQLVEVIQSKENDIRLLQEEHSNELQETRRRIEEETTENARKEFQPINDMANEARRELAANLEELETLNAYKEGVDEQLSKLERTNNLDPELATSILVDLHNKLSGILDPDGAEFSDDLHSIVETLVQENKDAREALKKIFETQLTQGETGSLSELVSKLNDKFLSVMSNVGTISGKDRLLEENTIVINELTERVQKLIGIIEEDHTQLTPSQIIQVDQDIAVVSSKIRNIQERIRQNTALDTETEEEKNTRLLADYQIGKEMEKLQDESRSLYRRKSIGMSIPPQLYKDTIDLMDKLEIGTTDNEGNELSYFTRVNLMYARIVEHFDDAGGHILKETPGSRVHPERILLWAFKYYTEAIANWREIFTAATKKLVDSSSKSSATLNIFIETPQGRKLSETITLRKVAANLAESSRFHRHLISMLDPVGSVEMSPELLINLLARTKDLPPPPPGMRLSWEKRVFEIPKITPTPDIDRPTVSSNNKKRMNDSVENYGKKIKPSISITPVPIQVDEPEIQPRSTEKTIGYFVENLRRPSGKTGEGVKFSLQEHTGVYTNSLLQLNSMLVSEASSPGSAKDFVMMRSEKLFTGDRLNKVNIVKTNASVGSRTRFKVKKIVEVPEFIENNRIDMVTSVNLENSSIRAEYDSVINRLVEHLDDRVITRRNDDLVTLNGLLDNGGRERLVYLLINLFGINVKQLAPVGFGFRMVQVVAPSIDLATDSSLLSDMASMFMWF